MTFTARIRTYLLLTATLPVLIVMAVIYYHTVGELEQTERVNAVESLRRVDGFNATYLSPVKESIKKTASGPMIKRALVQAKAGAVRRIDLTADIAGLDFLELIDNNKMVLASYHRPGLVGQPVQPLLEKLTQNTQGFFETVEYDADGAHIAFASVVPLEGDLSLYAGIYLDTAYRALMGGLLQAEVSFIPGEQAGPEYSSMTTGQVYQIESLR